MSNTIDRVAGEIKVELHDGLLGKIKFSDFEGEFSGFYSKGGHLRIVFNLEKHDVENFYQVPTIQIGYDKAVKNSHWIVEYNGETVLDKIDHHGVSSTLLLNRNKLKELNHRHENQLVLHCEFTEEVNLVADESYVHLFNS